MLVAAVTDYLRHF